MMTPTPYPTPARAATGSACAEHDASPSTCGARVVLDLSAGTVEIPADAEEALALAAEAALGAGLRVLGAARGGAR